MFVDDGQDVDGAGQGGLPGGGRHLGAHVESRVPIEVQATATDLGPGFLGFAGPYDFLRNEGGTVVPEDRDPTAAEVRDDVFEPLALFNARTGKDNLPPDGGELNPDIEAEFNLNTGGLYFGTDARPAAEPARLPHHRAARARPRPGPRRHGAGRRRHRDRRQRGVNGSIGVRSGVSFDQFTYATTAAQAGTGGTRCCRCRRFAALSRRSTATSCTGPGSRR